MVRVQQAWTVNQTYWSLWKTWRSYSPKINQQNANAHRQTRSYSWGILLENGQKLRLETWQGRVYWKISTAPAKNES